MLIKEYILTLPSTFMIIVSVLSCTPVNSLQSSNNGKTLRSIPVQYSDMIYVEEGEFHSRSEFIRDAVRKAEMIRSLSEIRRIIGDEGITEEELIESGKEIRRQLFREMFGDVE